ncbi:MinD-like ATPase involved in chromosome partitioning or flagellar assembly [Lipingzhangella halophila]|uniref:MinD-like ATPase involved in chromosome partitioning or flagellar assembly n=1 Tax=Lipingzhangella halophila TaxID=1783352 RepID=A0A7W7W1B1_9ACTN|nr:MinD/ParA family protein [Lipingzhangella halophila]MBB4930133.1 MinD-like ATPase involved in chromosome partitioning or flagellar assembly [Lipingzhangella halophila]
MPPFSDGARKPGAAHDAFAQDFPSDLSADSLIHRARPSPRRGWRRTLFTLSRGRVNPGYSKAEVRLQELEAAIRGGAVSGSRRSIAVLGAQRGVGTSTTVLGLGALLAGKRGDRVVAVDADPERSPLSNRGQVREQPQRPMGDLLYDTGAVLRYSQISNFVAQDASGLDVLPSSRDDTGGALLSGPAYRRIADAVERFYSLLVVDAGSGVDRPAVPAILERADQLVLVAHPSFEGANRAATALDDIADLGGPELASSAIIVLARSPRGHRSKLDDLERQLARRCQQTVRVSRDGTLRSRNVVDPSRMGPKALFGYLELAAGIVRAFNRRG